MGMSSLAVVNSVISQIYDLTTKMRQLTEEKMRLSQVASHVGRLRSQALQVSPFQMNAGILTPILANNQNGQLDFVRQYQSKYNGAPGHEYVQRDAALSQYESYLREITDQEKLLDGEMEQARAKLQALNHQKEEFQRYVAENIKTTFRNAYQA